MHGDVRVAKISVDPQGSIKSIVKIESTDHMPPGTLTDGWETTVRLNEWGLKEQSLLLGGNYIKESKKLVQRHRNP